jgi:hypothetical protein
MSGQNNTAEKMGAIIGTICYWFILFSISSFIFMFSWNEVLTTLFQIKGIKFYESMLLMLSIRSVSLCFGHSK